MSASRDEVIGWIAENEINFSTVITPTPDGWQWGKATDEKGNTALALVSSANNKQHILPADMINEYKRRGQEGVATHNPFTGQKRLKIDMDRDPHGRLIMTPGSRGQGVITLRKQPSEWGEWG